MVEITTKPNLIKRIKAFLIDYSLVSLYYLFVEYFFGTQGEHGVVRLEGFPAVSLYIVWFVLLVVVEQFNRGTIGNSAMKLKVISLQRSHTRISWGQSIKRHTLDTIDFMGFGVVAYILIKNTIYNQRLGDLWAKTVVIDTEDTNQGISEIPE
ncbi:MAG: RDD family protein [Bacteroidetes bacterium]|nr:RDD family protein [Bacteroidota bacterium]